MMLTSRSMASRALASRAMASLAMVMMAMVLAAQRRHHPAEVPRRGVKVVDDALVLVGGLTRRVLSSSPWSSLGASGMGRLLCAYRYPTPMSFTW